MLFSCSEFLLHMWRLNFCAVRLSGLIKLCFEFRIYMKGKWQQVGIAESLSAAAFFSFGRKPCPHFWLV